MKIKNFGLLYVFLIIASAVQPICAAEFHETQIVISEEFGNCQNHYNIGSYTDEGFKATLYDHYYDPMLPTVWRYLDFYVYKVNKDGFDIVPYYHAQKMTNVHGIATISDIQFEPGDYLLMVTYGGNKKDLLSPCNATVKLHVI